MPIICNVLRWFVCQSGPGLNWRWLLFLYHVFCVGLLAFLSLYICFEGNYIHAHVLILFMSGVVDVLSWSWWRWLARGSGRVATHWPVLTLRGECSAFWLLIGRLVCWVSRPYPECMILTIYDMIRYDMYLRPEALVGEGSSVPNTAEVTGVITCILATRNRTVHHPFFDYY